MFSLGQDQRKEIIFAIFIRICLTIRKIGILFKFGVIRVIL